MTDCQRCWNKKCGRSEGKCKKFEVPGCWQGFDTWHKQPGKGKCKCKTVRNWYTRRTGTSYNSILDTGPAGHPKANSFSPILFEKNVPVWLWLDNAVKKGRGPKCCAYRCKGQGRLKKPTPRTTVTPGQSTTSKSVAPAFQSFETVLAVRKAMAYYEPCNFKKTKRWRRANCRY